ncbi:hypothetical protein C8J56DRAFT_1100578 [Mycena floridula]|nr:hypothetical protein C8J56DRAFT_1100578 [Mycena floridula]
MSSSESESFSLMSSRSDAQAIGESWRATSEKTIPRLRGPFNARLIELSLAHVLFFALHILLIIIHIVILILGHYRIPNQVHIPLGDKTAFFNTAFSTASQTFAIVYLTILLFITQRLALRRVLSSAKTMTALHDRQSAWTGLGSAVNVLWNQHSVPASVWGVGVVTLYLAFTAGLKITTPGLLTLVSVNQTGSTTVQSTLSDPALLLSMWAEYVASRESTQDTLAIQQNMDSLRTSASHITILLKDTLMNPNFGRGLQGNMLYDVVDLNAGAGNISVNAHFMNVECGTEASMNTDVSANLTGDTSNKPGVWVGSESGNTFDLIARNGIIFNNAFDPNAHPYASFAVLDSAGENAPQGVLNPPMNPLMFGTFNEFTYNGTLHRLNATSGDTIGPYLSQMGLMASYNHNVSSLSVFQCSLTVEDSTVKVDAQTRLPLEIQPRKTSSAWSQFPNAKYPASDVPIIPDTLPTLWADSLQFSTASSTNVTFSSLCNLDLSWSGFSVSWEDCTYMTQAERFILDKLSISPSTDDMWIEKVPMPTAIPAIEVATVALHDFENAMEDYTAAWFWSRFNLKFAVLYLSGISEASPAQVSTLEVVSELQVVNLPVITGLVLSILLLIIAPAIVGWKYQKASTIPVKTLGLLETLWLAGAGDEIAHVEIPSGENLRHAGMSVSADLHHRQRWVD